MRHLTSDHIDHIALQLDEDVYGANGDLDQFEIKRRLIEAIHESTGHQYAADGVMPVWQAADLILGVWEDKDRDYMAELSKVAKGQTALSDKHNP